MPTTVSRQELDELRDFINEHIERTGESVTSLAKRAGMTRRMVSELRSGSYPSNPGIDVLQRIGSVLGKRLIWVDAN